MKETLQLRLRSIGITFLVVILTIFMSSNSSQALFNYIETKVMTENNAAFFVNGIEGKHLTVSTNDTIQSKDESINFVLNNSNSIQLAPKSSIVFLKLGESPIIKVLFGSVEIQTINTATVYAGYTVATVQQGGLKVDQTENYSRFGNYYGAISLAIYGKDKSLATKYNLPLQKQVTVYKKVNKSNWDKIRYSKLNKELRLKPFQDIVIRESFILKNLDSYADRSQSSFLQELLTINPNRQKQVQEDNFNEKIEALVSAIKNKSPAQVKRMLNELVDHKNNPRISVLQNLEHGINDPFTRYTFESESSKLFGEKHTTLNTEIKYFYTLWGLKDVKNLTKLYSETNAKIDAHKNTLLQLEEDYNLITALIEAYPDLATREILKSKESISQYLFDLVPTTTEKIDIILSAFEKDLHIIQLLVENNNGELAKSVYNNMLVHKEFTGNKIIAEYRKQLKDIEDNALTLLSFYKEYLHSAAFNETIYKRFYEDKKKEERAVDLFKNNEEETNKEEVHQDFSELVETFNEEGIYAAEENISYVLLGGKLLFIQDAEWIPGDGTTFNFVFDPEENIVSQVVWNAETPFPPMNDHLPLNKFRSAFLELQKVTLGDKEKEETLPIDDWANLAEDTQNNSLEAAIKKRLAKEKLAEVLISAREDKMKMYNTTMHVSNASIQYTDDKKRDIIVPLDIRLNLKNWSILGIKMLEYPTNKLRVQNLSNVYETILNAHKEEVLKDTIRSDAHQILRTIVPEVLVEDFHVEDTETRTVSFERLPYTFKLLNIEESWSISGTYNVQTQIFPQITVYQTGKTVILNNQALSSFATTLKDQRQSEIQTQEKISQEETEQLIQEAVNQDLSEDNLEEIKNIFEGDSQGAGWF